jgi:hypothetical protein
MLLDVIPKLPMRNKFRTVYFYINQLGFELLGDYGNYLLIKKEEIELHFFEFESLKTSENYGQVYIRVIDIVKLYNQLIEDSIPIHPNGKLEDKHWGQREFSLLDPDNNLLTFGQGI